MQKLKYLFPSTPLPHLFFRLFFFSNSPFLPPYPISDSPFLLLLRLTFSSDCWFRSTDSSITVRVTYPLGHPCRRQDRFEVDITFDSELRNQKSYLTRSRTTVQTSEFHGLVHSATQASFMRKVLLLYHFY